MFDISEKVCILTGGSTGIGVEIGKELLRNGLKGLSILDVNEIAGLETVQHLNTEFGKDKVIFIKTDVSDKKQFEDAFKKTIDTFKNLDIVINNAGIVLDSDWEREIAVNFTGTVTGTVLALDTYLPKYKSGDEGVIVNVASMGGLYVYPGTPIYCGTKAGVVGLTRNIGCKGHYERNKIKVVSICPGYTDTSILAFSEKQTLGQAYIDVHNKALTIVNIQPPTAVAKGVAHIIKEANSGTVWVSNENKPVFEVEFPDHEGTAK